MFYILPYTVARDVLKAENEYILKMKINAQQIQILFYGFTQTISF